MIDPMFLYLLGLAVSSYLVVGSLYTTLQKHLEAELKDGEAELARKRNAILMLTDEEQGKTIAALRQELEIANVSRQDLFRYIVKIEKALDGMTVPVTS